MAAFKYVCREKHKEDLTARVNAELDRRARTSYVTFGGPRRWRVFVKCSQGHENVFEGESTTTLEPLQ